MRLVPLSVVRWGVLLVVVMEITSCITPAPPDSNDLPPAAPILIVLSGVTPTPPPPTATSSPAPASTAAPTATTVSPELEIAYIRVGFFGIRCLNGKEPPHQSLKQLPVGCKGAVTATPKNAAGRDVPLSVHGPDIDWRLDSGASVVDVRDHPTEAFNKDVIGLETGKFSLCATIAGVLGCLDGLVIP